MYEFLVLLYRICYDWLKSYRDIESKVTYDYFLMKFHYRLRLIENVHILIRIQLFVKMSDSKE